MAAMAAVRRSPFLMTYSSTHGPLAPDDCHVHVAYLNALDISQVPTWGSQVPSSPKGGRSVALTPSTVARLRHCGAPVKDRKSTRLNSSHLVISYAVFCLKKKKKESHTSTWWNAKIMARELTGLVICA